MTGEQPPTIRRGQLDDRKTDSDGLADALDMSKGTPMATMIPRVRLLKQAAEAAAEELVELRKSCTLCPIKDQRIADLQTLLAKHAELGDRLIATWAPATVELPQLPANQAALPEVHNLKTGDLLVARGSIEHFKQYQAQYRALIDLAERARQQGIYIEVLVLRPDIPLEHLSEEQMAEVGWARTPGWLDSQKDMPTAPTEGVRQIEVD